MRRILARLLLPFAALALVAFIACVSHGWWAPAMLLLPVIVAYVAL